MKYLPGLLIIGGTGRNSGKTTLACRLISAFSELEVEAVKISPHHHDDTEGATKLYSGEGFSVYLETSPKGTKDTSRMLGAGAYRAYYIHAGDNTIEEAFEWLLASRESDSPVICESPLLRRYFQPSLYIIADSRMVVKRKELNDISKLADMIVSYESPPDPRSRFSFRDGRWEINR